MLAPPLEPLGKSTDRSDGARWTAACRVRPRCVRRRQSVATRRGAVVTRAGGEGKKGEREERRAGAAAPETREESSEGRSRRGRAAASGGVRPRLRAGVALAGKPITRQTSDTVASGGEESGGADGTGFHALSAHTRAADRHGESVKTVQARLGQARAVETWTRTAPVARLRRPDARRDRLGARVYCGRAADGGSARRAARAVQTA